MMFHVSHLVVTLLLLTFGGGGDGVVKAQDSAQFLDNLATTVVIGGGDPTDSTTLTNIGWTDGVCYHPISGVIPGDILEFNFNGHDVYLMSSKEHWESCNFTDATMLAGVGGSVSPYKYQIKRDDITRSENGVLYFACSVGAHCQSGNQKVQVEIREFTGALAAADGQREFPISKFSLSIGTEQCNEIQASGGATNQAMIENGVQSDCTDPVFNETDGRYYVSCLSGPATMSPGGVINNLFMLHYPYPKDRRVAVGLRTWEFVADIPGGEPGIDIEPVPINQLYVHHLSGRVILGQGTEGIRRSEPDAPFVEPYALVTGDEGDLMIFHIIDLRNVTDWLPCIECRCKNDDGTYLDIGGSDDSLTGGVDCCHNCTSLTGPTLDYRMRYNVSYSDIKPEQPVSELLMLTADISPAVDKNLEFDVPKWTLLNEDEQKDTDPYIQRLERTMPFNLMFHHEFFGPLYSGPDTVKLFRCVGHLHVAAIGMWLEDAETGEMLCEGVGFYGTDETQDKGFLNAVAVDDYDEPKVFPADRLVTLVTEYNATILHTGVMGMEFIFVSGERTIHANDTKLTVDTCIPGFCRAALLPRVIKPDNNTAEEDVCEDTLKDHPACTFGNMCSCEEFVNAPESTGCGGMYTSDWGEIEINSVCRKYCDCPPVSSKKCEDALPTSPACLFGSLCSCEVFVNAAESTGCGGYYTSDWGEMPVNDMCANYCDACPDITPEEQMAMDFEEDLETLLKAACKYSTEECRHALNNLHACAASYPGVEDLDPVIQRLLTEKGHDMALEHAKLGDPSLHREQSDPAIVPECTAEEEGYVSQVTCNADGEDTDAGTCADYTSQYSVLCDCYYFCGSQLLGCLTSEESKIFSCSLGPVTTCHGANVEELLDSSSVSVSMSAAFALATGTMLFSLFAL